MKFTLVPPGQVDWPAMDRFRDRTFAQRAAWLSFLRVSQGARPVVATLSDGGETVGYFTGAIVKRFGLRIMGSPFPGWTTPHMGFNLREGVSRAAALRALVPFVFRELGCVHLELGDPNLLPDDAERLGFSVQVGTTFESDLTQGEATLFSSMDSACRRCIRKAEKSAVSIEEARPAGFAREYHEHLTDVFAKQQLRPTYGLERVEALVDHVFPSGDLLLLRARNQAGRSIATGIFPGFNQRSFFWGNGSLREFHALRPNEALHWHAMRYWKSRGVHTHDWGGGGDYKEKYGGTRVATRHYRLARFGVVGFARDMARTLYYFPRTIRRRIHLHRIGRDA